MRKKSVGLDEKVFEGVFPMILRIVQKRRMQSSVLDHEDLVQEGVLGLLQSHKRFDSARKVKLSTFAYRRIDGNVRDAQEREQNHLKFVSPVEDEQLNTEASSLELESDEIRMQLYDKMIFALENNLPEEQAVILIDFFFNGKPLKIIARERRISPRNLQMLYDAGLLRLKKAITKT